MVLKTSWSATVYVSTIPQQAVIFVCRKSQWPTFIFVFAYLLFFRTCTYLGFKEPAKHCNAIQLLVTLRVSCYLIQRYMV